MKFIVPALLAMLSILRAETITLKDGTTIENVTVTKVEPNQITIMNSEGVQKVKMEKLSPELQKKYEYDPERAAVYVAKKSQEQAEAKARQDKIAKELAKIDAANSKRAEMEKGAVTIRGKVYRKTQGGVIMDCTSVRADGGEIKSMPKFVSGYCFLVDHPDFSNLADDDHFTITAYPIGNREIGGSTYHAYTAKLP